MSSDTVRWSSGQPRRQQESRNDGANLADILERVLDKGIVIAGDIQVNLLDIELLTIKIRLVVASVDRAKEMGIDWWERDPTLSAGRQDLETENAHLRERVEALERAAGHDGLLPAGRSEDGADRHRDDDVEDTGADTEADTEAEAAADADDFDADADDLDADADADADDFDDADADADADADDLDFDAAADADAADADEEQQPPDRTEDRTETDGRGPDEPPAPSRRRAAGAPRRRARDAPAREPVERRRARDDGTRSRRR